MRRPARRLFTPCSLLSMLLCIAVCVLWVRSRGTVFGASWSGARTSADVWLSDGTCAVVLTTGAERSESGPQAKGLSLTSKRVSDPTVKETFEFVAAYGATYYRQWRGFAVLRAGAPSGGALYGTCFPVWLAALPLCVPPASWLVRRRRLYRQRRGGLCLGCGYDVRTSPARCSECGMAPTAAGGRVRRIVCHLPKLCPGSVISRFGRREPRKMPAHLFRGVTLFCSPPFAGPESNRRDLFSVEQPARFGRHDYPRPNGSDPLQCSHLRPPRPTAPGRVILRRRSR